MYVRCMNDIPSSFETAKKRRLELHDAMAGLEWALARASEATDWRVAVIESLHNLLSAYRSHSDEVEAPNGILNDLLVDAPRLSNYVAILKNDHMTIMGDLEALLSDAAEIPVSELREIATSLLGDLVRHRQMGADLVWDAVNLDIGGHG